MLAAPAASRTKVESTRVSHYRYAETIRPSLRNGVTAYSALSSVNRAFLPPSPRIMIRKLDPSVGRSGPHAFAVRTRHHSSVDADTSIASRAQHS
jgi:hypothetical protein